MIDVPNALKLALAERRTADAASPAVLTAPDRVVVGDLRIVASLPHRQADSRILLVLNVDGPDDFADVMLVHSATEFATDRDAIVLADNSEAAYDLVVQTDLRTVVWTFQIGSRVGRLSEECVAAIKAWANDHSDGELRARRSEVAGIDAGTRLAGLLDRRWAFKESEGNTMRQLASDCVEVHLDHGLVWRIHPGLLQPDLLDLADDREALLGELVHWAATRTLSLADDDLEFLLMAGALDVDSWAQFGDLGTDLLMGLQDAVLGGATGVRVGTESESRGLVAATHLDPVDRAELADSVHNLGAKEPVPS